MIGRSVAVGIAQAGRQDAIVTLEMFIFMHPFAFGIQIESIVAMKTITATGVGGGVGIRCQAIVGKIMPLQRGMLQRCIEVEKVGAEDKR